MEFAGKWLKEIERIEDTKHFDYFKFYVINLSPAFLGNESHKAEMQHLLAKYENNSSKSYLCRCLKEEIHEIDNVLKLKSAYK